MTTAAELLNAYQEDDVVSWLGADTVKKARPYVDLVQQLEVGTERISAQVPGSARQAYRTDIVFIDFKQQVSLLTTCSCPVRRNCKHVAAALLRAIAERNPAVRLSSSVLSWVEDLRRASVAVEIGRAHV